MLTTQIKFEPMSEHFVAQVHGVDLAEAQDADAIAAYSREQIAAHGLEVEEVRDAVVKYLFGDQILPIDPALHPKP